MSNIDEELLRRYNATPDGGMLAMTDAERMRLQDYLGQQARLQRQSPLWPHLTGLQGMVTGGAVGAAIGAPIGAPIGSERWYRAIAWKPPKIIDDPPPWVGWSYLWRGCCALGALGAWVGFVLFLCWIAR